MPAPRPSSASLIPHVLFIGSLLVILSVPLGAQGAARCAASEHRQFDFWIGQWSVTNPKGAVVGTSRIESVLGGCAIQEHWKGAGAGEGTSLNVWNAADSTWQQFWIDGTGGVLELSGGLQGSSMVLSGTAKAAGGSGGTSLNRITWTPGPKGTVRQLWESSVDNGATWTIQFDGTYTRTP